MEKAEVKQLLSKAESLELTEQEHQKAQGSFITLAAGTTHYELKGGGGDRCFGARLLYSLLYLLQAL